jgi:hypothetical protein
LEKRNTVKMPPIPHDPPGQATPGYKELVHVFRSPAGEIDADPEGKYQVSQDDGDVYGIKCAEHAVGVI